MTKAKAKVMGKCFLSRASFQCGPLKEQQVLGFHGSKWLSHSRLALDMLSVTKLLSICRNQCLTWD